ncbi:MAG: insulinase family protein [Actinomycetia bacterium]|nr:insulinase family protein [Actinomycetes bacterium]
MSAPTDRVRRTLLDNGLRVVTDEQPDRAMLSVAAWVSVGSRDESEQLSGASHFLEHLLFKGTADRDARSIAVAIDAIGAEMNAFTASEHTAFYTNVPVHDAHVAVDLLLDVLDKPLLASREVDAERHVILDELAAAQQDPDDLASVTLFESLFPGHPLGRETLGTGESIRGISSDDIRGFFESWYLPANLVIAAAGPIDHDLLVEEVASRFSAKKAGTRPERQAPECEVVSRAFHERPTELAHLGIGWRAPSVQSDDRYALSLLNHVFGGGPSSLLFQEARESRGLTYSIGSEVAQHVDAGALTVHCATLAEQAPRLLEVIEGITTDLAEHGIDREALARAKGAMRGSMLMGLESPVARMTRLGVGEVMRGEVLPVQEHLERIEAVTVDDVRRVSADVFGGPSARSLVGPVDIPA